MSNRLIGDELAAALNEQVGHEFEASLQYVSLATYFAGANLYLLAKLFQDQSDEERRHALKLTDYLVKAGAPVQIPALAQPRSGFASPEEAVGLALDWEVEVTDHYNRLMEKAIGLNDYLAQGFLGWFVTEQLEEVSKMRRLLDIVRRAGTNILMVEAYLAHDGGGLSE